MQARKILAIAMVTLSAVTGAAVPATAATGDGRSEDVTVTLVVQNNNVRAVTIYAVTTDGKLRRLGRVGGIEERSFEISESLLQDGRNLQIKVFHPQGPKGGLAHGALERSEGIKTYPIAVESGSTVDLWVDRDLRASRVFRSDG